MKALTLPYAETQDSILVARILAGEKELFEILMRRNNQKLYRVIRSYLSHEDEVEDVMQNTYLKSFEKLHQFKNEARFSTWLIRIGINEALGMVKSNGKLLSMFRQEPNWFRKKLIHIQDPEYLNPEKKMIKQEARQMLEKAIDKLPVKYRSIYMLSEIEGMSTMEIGDCLNLTISNVKVRLHRARVMIKETLFELSFSKDVFEFGFGRCDGIVHKVMSQITLS